MERPRPPHHDPILRPYDHTSSVHAHGSVTSKKWWLGFCCAVLGILLLLYLPVYHQLQTRIVGISGWNYNTSRDMRLYVLPDNTTAVLQPSQLCTSDLFLLVIVCSAVENFEARLAIRKSWGSEALVDNATVRVVFLLGQTENQSLQERLRDEHRQYEDLIQERFLDSYNNLTLKSVMLLKWVTQHCAGAARFVMKTDDDMYVNLAALAALLRARPNATGLLTGSLICGARPIADSKSKWYAPKYMYPGSVYPNYLSGTGYVMSGDVVRRLYRAALLTRLFHLEDVYVTGMCARAARVRPQNHAAFSYQRRRWDPCVYRAVVTSHKVAPREMVSMHRLLRTASVLEHCDRAALLPSTPAATERADRADRADRRRRVTRRRSACL